MLRALLANLRAGATAPRRQHDHAAGREERAARSGAHLRAEDPRDDPRAAARAGADQGRDLSLYLNTHLSRARSLRDRRGVALLLRQEGQRISTLPEAALFAGLGRVARALFAASRRSPGRSLDRRRYVLDQMLREELHHPGSTRLGAGVEGTARAAADGESELAPEVVSLRQEGARRRGRRERRARRLHDRDDDRSRAAGRRAPAVRENLDNYAIRQSCCRRSRRRRAAVGAARDGRAASEQESTSARSWPPNDAARHARRASRGRARSRRADQRGALQPEASAAERVRKRRRGPCASACSRRPTACRPSPLRLELGPESALVALDVRIREVRALIGSYEAITRRARPRDATRTASRVSRSSPCSYSYALHSRRFTPASVLDLPQERHDPKSRSPRR